MSDRRTQAARQPQRSPKRAPSKPAKPSLRVVDAKAVNRRRRQRRVLLGLGVVFMVGCFVVAAAQAMLVQGQRELDDVRLRIAEAEGEQDRLVQRLVDARSPETIIARAEAMGMVRADDPVYLVAVRNEGTGP